MHPIIWRNKPCAFKFPGSSSAVVLKLWIGTLLWVHLRCPAYQIFTWWFIISKTTVLEKQWSNLMVGVTTAPGTVLKGCSIRKAENCYDDLGLFRASSKFQFAFSFTLTFSKFSSIFYWLLGEWYSKQTRGLRGLGDSLVFMPIYWAYYLIPIRVFYPTLGDSVPRLRYKTFVFIISLRQH